MARRRDRCFKKLSSALENEKEISEERRRKRGSGFLLQVNDAFFHAAQFLLEGFLVGLQLGDTLFFGEEATLAFATVTA